MPLNKLGFASWRCNSGISKTHLTIEELVANSRLPKQWTKVSNPFIDLIKWLAQEDELETLIWTNWQGILNVNNTSFITSSTFEKTTQPIELGWTYIAKDTSI